MKPDKIRRPGKKSRKLAALEAQRREALRPPKRVGFNPNHVPRSERAWYALLSLFLILYGTYGLWIDDLYIFGKRKGMHFHGEPAWIIFGAMLCAVANMVSLIVDHYDKRNNEINYRRFARLTEILGWTLFISALVLDAVVFQKAHR